MRRCVAAVAVIGVLLSGCQVRKPQVNVSPEGYDARSQQVYDASLGAFYEAYQKAQEADTVSERYARMAVAEAKLLASAVMLPMTAGGGSYTISRVAPYTAPYSLWGNDPDRTHTLLVVDRPILSEHVEQMKAQWAKVRGSGSYREWAEDFLTGEGYVLRDRYRMAYSSDPKIWDALATSRTADLDAVVNTYDGLYRYDSEGILQGALAAGYEVSHNADGTVDYIFKLREGPVWVDAQGRTVAPVLADDFVAGFQHMMDAAGGSEYLVDGLIAGASEYLSGQVTDMDRVGVKALDDTTLVYTLTEDRSYFMTMLGYSVFAPLCRSYYQSKGGGFGQDFDDADPSYTYGKDPDAIAYCGPYLVTNATAENTIVFSANPSYWDADAVRLKQVIWRYNDGSDALRAYQDTVSDTIDTVDLNASSIEKAKSDGNFTRYAHISTRNATTYFAFYNLDRRAFSNFNDGTAATGKSEEEIRRSAGAMSNVHFRRALSLATDRAAYNAQVTGEELKETSLRNSFVPGNFVSLPEAVRIRIGDREVDYPAGTWYGQILQDAIREEGLPVTVWDPEAEAGAGSSDGFDGWYDPQAARAELALALEELGTGTPIIIDLPYFSGSDTVTNRAYAYKLSVETVLGDGVRVDLIPCASNDQVLYAGYYAGLGSEANYDVYDRSGWGPDYGDPQTYLDTLLPGYEGYLTRMLGIF